MVRRGATPAGGIRARVARGLRALGRTRGQERKRLRDAMADAVVGAQAAAAEGGRRKTARLGGEVAGTRAGGIHRVGAYAQHERRRGVPVEWEAGDAKRSRAAGVAQRRDADGARRKADGTLVGVWLAKQFRPARSSRNRAAYSAARNNHGWRAHLRM